MNAVWIRTVWERKGLTGRFLWCFALPFAFIYYLAVLFRGIVYFFRWIPRQTLPCAVVSVGNLTVGGTGKTPVTLWLARELGRRGYRVAILSRGYKRTGKEPTIVDPGLAKAGSIGQGSHSVDPGDEPMMMAKVFAQNVAVGRKRYEAGNLLWRKAAVDVFLLDDGFQHRQLNRDLDLLLLGSDWEGWLLPAGPFREPRSALYRAHLYLITGARERWLSYLNGRPKEAVFFGCLEPRALLTLDGNRWKEFPLTLLDRSKIVAVSAIANPGRFYRLIHDWGGEIVDALEYPDHYSYSIKDWQRINRAARNVDLIVTTEKDILKLVRFPFAREKLFALRVEMVVDDGNSLLQAVEDVIQRKKAQA